jgi:hypothetical protein
MARIKIQSVIEKLDYELKRALEDAVGEVMPGAHIDRDELYRAFKRAVGRKCSTWVRIPDHHVQGG